MPSMTLYLDESLNKKIHKLSEEYKIAKSDVVIKVLREALEDVIE